MTSLDPGKKPQGSGQEWICRFQERGFCGKQSYGGISVPQGSACREVSPLGATEAQNCISNTPYQTCLPSSSWKGNIQQSPESCLLSSPCSPVYCKNVWAVNSPNERTTSHTVAPTLDTAKDTVGWHVKGCEALDRIQGRKGLLLPRDWGSHGGKGEGVTPRQVWLEAGILEIICKCSVNFSSAPPGILTNQWKLVWPWGIF